MNLNIWYLLWVWVRTGKVAVLLYCTFSLLGRICVDRFIVCSQLYTVTLWQFISLQMQNGIVSHILKQAAFSQMKQLSSHFSQEKPG